MHAQQEHSVLKQLYTATSCTKEVLQPVLAAYKSLIYFFYTYGFQCTKTALERELQYVLLLVNFSISWSVTATLGF